LRNTILSDRIVEKFNKDNAFGLVEGRRLLLSWMEFLEELIK
jgi:hypothetical protein